VRRRAIPASAAVAGRSTRFAFNTNYAVTVAAHDGNGSGNLDSAAEVQAALGDSGAGGASDLAVVKLFECPVIPVPSTA